MLYAWDDAPLFSFLAERDFDARPQEQDIEALRSALSKLEAISGTLATILEHETRAFRDAATLDRLQHLRATIDRAADITRTRMGC